MTSAAAVITSRPLLRRELAPVAVLFALAAVSWWVTGRRMDGMASGPTTDLGSLGFYATSSAVMMAAMMFPSVWPVVSLYERIRSRRPDVPGSGTTLLVAGYLAVWTVCGLTVFATIGAARSVFGDFLPWHGVGRWTAAGVVLAAAAYQLTPAKDACLSRCRGPFEFVTSHWRRGRVGALRMGVVHGLWCVGCCWALIAALFALGVMSLGWMAVIAGFIAAEKLVPWRALANYGVALILVVIAIGLVAAPDAVPGMPGAAAASHAMMGR